MALQQSLQPWAQVTSAAHLSFTAAKVLSTASTRAS